MKILNVGLNFSRFLVEKNTLDEKSSDLFLDKRVKFCNKQCIVKSLTENLVELQILTNNPNDCITIITNN